MLFNVITMIKNALKNKDISPRYGQILCALLAFIPLLCVDMPHSLAYPAGIVALIFSGILYFVYGQKLTFSKTAMIVTFSALGLMTASLLWAKFPDVSQSHVVKMWPLFLPQILLISLIGTLPQNILKPYAHYIPIGFVIASIYLAFEILSGGMIFNLMRGYPVNVAADPDEFNSAAVVLALMGFAAWPLIKDRLPHPAWMVALFIPLLVALYKTESQSAQLCFLVGAICLFAFPYKSKIIWTGLKFLFPALVLITPFVMPHLYQLAADLQSVPILARGYVGHRFEIWDFISRYALQEPLHGYGVRATRMITDFDSHLIFNSGNMIMHPHNFAVQLWLEYGVIGAVTGAAVLYMLLDKLQKNFSVAQQRILFPTMIAALVPLSLAYSLWQGWWVGTLFYMAAIALLSVRLTAAKDE